MHVVNYGEFDGDPFALWSANQHHQHERAQEAKKRVRESITHIKDLLDSIDQDFTVIAEGPVSDDEGLRAELADLLAGNSAHLSGR